MNFSYAIFEERATIHSLRGSMVAINGTGAKTPSDIMTGFDTEGWPPTVQPWLGFALAPQPPAMQRIYQTVVPAVLGLTQTAATSALTVADLTISVGTPVYSSIYPAGVVATQSPSAGSYAPIYSPVVVQLSLGPAPVPGFRVTAVRDGYYQGNQRLTGDVFDLAFGTDYSAYNVSIVPATDPAYPVYGWMQQVPQTTPLVFQAQSLQQSGQAVSPTGLGRTVI